MSDEPKKLYRCEAKIVVYALDTNEERAQPTAARAMKEETPVTLDIKPAGVDGWGIPYSADADRTVAQILGLVTP